MDKTIVVFRKRTGISPSLKKLDIGESLKIYANVDSVRACIVRLNRQGRKYSGSVKGLDKGIIVTRLR